MSTKLQVTRYGLSKKAGGWDPYGDSETDKGLGSKGNILSYFACAITDSARMALGANFDDYLVIVFPDGRQQIRRIEDRAPELNGRVDLFYPWADDPSIPDYADVSILKT
jgi:hypothetical protein